MARPKGIPAHNKKVHPEITCQICGKVFTVKAYMAPNRRFCSRACKGKASRGMFTGENSVRYSQVECACARCGKRFKVKSSYIRKITHTYCSLSCRYPERIEINCRWCNTPFKVTPFQKEKGRKQFCSDKCRGAYRCYIFSTERPRTSIEIAIEQALIEINEPYEEQKQIGYWLVDFYLPRFNLVVECDGKYWHSLPNAMKKDKQRNKWMTTAGYNILHLGEDAIRANAMQALTDGLRLHAPLS